MKKTKTIADPVRILPNFRYQLPLKFEFSPAVVGNQFRNLFYTGLVGLGLWVLLSTVFKHKDSVLFLLGALAAVLFGGLFYYSKKNYYQNKKLEVLVDENFLFFGQDLVRSPELWQQFFNGNYIRIAWSDIKDWKFERLDNESAFSDVGVGCIHYLIKFHSTDKVMRIDRELLLEVENALITVAQQMLAKKNEGRTMSNIPLSNESMDKGRYFFAELWFGVALVIAVAWVIWRWKFTH